MKMQIVRSTIHILLWVYVVFCGEPSKAQSSPQSNSGESSTTNNQFNPALWGPETNGFRLSLTAGKAKYKTGDSIQVTVRLKNVSNTSLHVSESGKIEDFMITVLDDHSNQVGLTEFGEKRKHARPSGSEFLLELGPDGELKYDYDLARIWDMNRPGIYRIAASRPTSYEDWQKMKAQGVPLEKRRFLVPSNTIEVEVVDM